MKNYLIILLLGCFMNIVLGALIIIFPDRMEKLITAKNKTDKINLRFLGYVIASFGAIYFIGYYILNLFN